MTWYESNHIQRIHTITNSFECFLTTMFQPLSMLSVIIYIYIYFINTNSLHINCIITNMNDHHPTQLMILLYSII